MSPLTLTISSAVWSWYLFHASGQTIEGIGIGYRNTRKHAPPALAQGFLSELCAPLCALRPNFYNENHPLRWRTASYRQIPVATETFRLSTCPAIGRRTN